MHSYLAVDIGASSGRHIVGYLEDGKLVTREVYRFPNGVREKDGHFVWDIQALAGHVLAGLRAAHEQGFSPVSVGIDTWAVDFVLLDGADGPVGDAVAYRDGRTEGMDAELEKTLSFGELYRITGIAKQPFNTIYQMMAMLREHPEYRERTRDFLMIPEYLAFTLTGVKKHEWTNASTTALCDARTKTWSPEVIAAAGLPQHWFAGRIAQPGERVGRFTPEVREAAGFDAQVTLVATHDTGSAYLAVPARDEGAAFLSSGTWSLLGTELSAPCAGPGSLEAGFTNEGGYAGTTRYLKNIMGLWMLQRIREETGNAYSFSEMADMAEASDYPAWVDATDNRFLAPKSMLDEVRAALAGRGAPEPKTLGDVLRAVNVSLAVCYRDAIAQMAALTGKAFTSLNIVGGGSQNAALNRLTAKWTGLPVFAGPAEGTAMGNLVVQMIAAGELADVRQGRDMIARSFEILRY